MPHSSDLLRIWIFAAFAFGSHAVIAQQKNTQLAPFSASITSTPEKDRASLIAAIKKRIPGVPVDEWSLAAATVSAGVTVTPLGGANATNINDILAIGKKQWERKFNNGKSFANCFPNGGQRVAANFPQFDPGIDNVVTLEMAIERCLAQHGELAFVAPDTLMLGALSAYLRSLSVGQKLNIRVSADEPGARARYNAGRSWFSRRLGEKDLACASCHVLQAGRNTDGSTLSPAIGQVLAWPRVEPGGKLRSLQQQFQRCMQRIGAEPFPTDAQPYTDLVYFLSSISNGLTIRPVIATQ